MKTTKAHFKIFKAECKKWVEYFGFLDWSVNFHHKTTQSGKNTYATVGWNTSGRRCDIYFTEEWDEVTEYQIKKTAFHEVCHMLHMPLSNCATARYTTQAEISQAEHTIVRRLENTIFKAYLKEV